MYMAPQAMAALPRQGCCCARTSRRVKSRPITGVPNRWTRAATTPTQPAPITIQGASAILRTMLVEYRLHDG